MRITGVPKADQGVSAQYAITGIHKPDQGVSKQYANNWRTIT